MTLTEGGTSVTITIPPGNYNINSFCQTVAPLLTAGSPNGLTYTMTYDNNYTQVNTGKIYYSVNTNSIACSFTFTTLPIYEQFGFSANSTNTFTVGVSTSDLTSSNVVKFVCEDSVFIHSNLVQNFGNSNSFSDTLQEVFNNNSIPLSSLIYTNPSPYDTSKFLSTAFTRSATFSLTDENGIPLYLNGLNVVLHFMIFRDQDYFEQSKQYMSSMKVLGDNIIEKMDGIVEAIKSIEIQAPPPVHQPTTELPLLGQQPGPSYTPLSTYDIGPKPVGQIQTEPTNQPDEKKSQPSEQKIITEPV